MESRMEIDFMDLNSRPQSGIAKQHTKASGMKWPFSSMPELTTQPEKTIFFQNSYSSPGVSSNSKSSLHNNYFKESQFFGGALPLVTKTSTYDSRNICEHAKQSESTLTIFYLGEVHIFEDITAEKAELILDMASNSTNLHMNEILEEVNKEKSEENKLEPTTDASTEYAKGALAMARRATLARFLEKRKHRLIKARPYQHGEKTPKFPYDIQQEEETASSSVHWES